MTSGFTLIPEGEYVFFIEDVKYDEKFGTLEVKLVTADGMKHTERFSLMDNNGDGDRPAVWDKYEEIVKANEGDKNFELMERFAFYDRARKAYAVIATGETAVYANIILKKGVVK